MGHAPLAIWPAEAPEGVFFLGCCCLFRCEISEGGVIFGNIPGRRGGSRWGSLDLAFLPAYLARRGPPPRGRAVRVRAIAPAPRSVPRTTMPIFSRRSPLGSANEKQTSSGTTNFWWHNPKRRRQRHGYCTPRSGKFCTTTMLTLHTTQLITSENPRNCPTNGVSGTC